MRMPGSAHAAGAHEKSARRRRLAALVASILLLSTLAGGLYLRIGPPEFLSAAAAARGDTPDWGAIDDMVAQVEAHLGRSPDDGRAWEVLAPVYMRLGQYEKSVLAWQNAQRLLGESAEREENLGESLVAAAGGAVTADAKAAFDRAVAIDGNSVSARFYLGRAAAQAGRREEAAKIWGDLVASAPAGALWAAEVRAALARLDDQPAARPSGPSASDMQAAAKLPPGQQDAMISGMVERLAARLRADGDDPDGWIRLVRSYNVLGSGERASAAVADARSALAAAPAKLSRFEAALKSLSSAAPVGAPGPEAVAAADQMAPEQRTAMIHAMVDRLAGRLKQDGGDVEGWLRLMRSYAVLGETGKAREAVVDARKAIGADAEKLHRIDDGERQLGL
jgi:cytochrome c-type biogenesis protein CcmH